MMGTSSPMLSSPVRQCHTLWHWVMFLLVVICFYSWSRASGGNDDRKIVTVDNRPGNPSAADYTDLVVAVNAAVENTTIRLQKGVYVIDNPIVLVRTGIRIAGEGRKKTIIRPRNAGKAIFKFKANNLGVENLGMDAKLENEVGRATFGVHIKEGYAHSKVMNTQIVNTGASAIIGSGIRDSKVDGNIILNAGDDGIQKRGDRLTVSNNVVVGYFDEAIDLAAGRDIVVSNNYVKSGRIGITVGGATNAVIACNTVEDHFHGGIAVESQGGGIVSHNAVKDSVQSAYRLHSVEVIDSNRAEGNHLVGFEIRNVRKGTIGRNEVVGARRGFDLVQSSGNLMYGNQYLGDGEAIHSDEEGSHKNVTKRPIPTGDQSQSDVDQTCMAGDNVQGLVADETGLSVDKDMRMNSLVGRLDDNIRKSHVVPDILLATGESERDKAVAAGLVNFLSRNNPGFLSIHVQGNVKTSQITEDLYMTLKGSGGLGIGLVRLPIKILRGGSRTIFPVWHLMVGAREVAIVTVRPSGIGAHILFTENGQSRLMRWVTLSMSHIAYKIDTAFGHRLESIYRNRTKWLSVAFLLLACLLGLVIVWRIRKRKFSRDAV